MLQLEQPRAVRSLLDPGNVTQSILGIGRDYPSVPASIARHVLGPARQEQVGRGRDQDDSDDPETDGGSLEPAL